MPLLLEGFDFGTSAIAEQLEGTLEPLKHYNAVQVPAAYFAEAMQRLRDKYLSIPLNAVLHPPSLFAQQSVKEQQTAAGNAPSVQEKELTREELNRRLVDVVKAPIPILRSSTADIQILSGELTKLQIVIALVEDGAAVNAIDENGETALHWAAYYGHALIVRYLLEHGADASIKGRPGRTALDWATKSDDSIRLLRERGTDEDKSLLEYIRKHIGA